MSSFLHQRNAPTGKIRYLNRGVMTRRNYEENKNKNKPVIPRCAKNFAQPEDFVVGRILVYIS